MLHGREAPGCGSPPLSASTLLSSNGVIRHILPFHVKSRRLQVRPFAMTRTIAVLALPGVQLLDVSGPLDVFAQANVEAGRQVYTLQVVACEPGPIHSSSGARLLPDLVAALQSQLAGAKLPRVAFHPPCTLQHGQKLRGGIESQLRALGFEVEIAGEESHLCCGSAGTYSVLQPELSLQLRDRKLVHLKALEPQGIVSANIGCITHLQSGSDVPVKHWIEMVDEALSKG